MEVETKSKREYFSATYLEARKRILDVAGNLNAKVISIPLGKTGISGEDLYTDIIWLGSENPKKVFFHSSGVHGVEGYAGSAIQLQFLSEFQADIIPENTAIVFIHVVNPFGMSWLRRWNENNVDSNRNCLTDDLWVNFAPQTNPVYGDFDGFLNPKQEPWNWSVDFWTKSAYYVASYGYTASKQGVAGGQYRFEKGIFYGGNEIQPGIQNVMRCLIEHFSNVEHYCQIDVHTGLGPKSYDTFLCEGKEEEDWLQCLGDHVDRSLDSTGTSYDMKGSFNFGMYHLFHSDDKHPGGFSFLNESPEITQTRKESTKSYNGITQEFGTLPALEVLKALREENCYYHLNKEGEFKSHWSKDQLLNAFWIKEPEWEETILSRGMWAIQTALKYIANK